MIRAGFFGDLFETETNGPLDRYAIHPNNDETIAGRD